MGKEYTCEGKMGDNESKGLFGGHSIMIIF